MEKKKEVFDRRKPIYRAFGDFGVSRTFTNKRDADKWAKARNGEVLHVGWKLKKMM